MNCMSVQEKRTSYEQRSQAYQQSNSNTASRGLRSCLRGEIEDTESKKTLLFDKRAGHITSLTPSKNSITTKIKISDGFVIKTFLPSTSRTRRNDQFDTDIVLFRNLILASTDAGGNANMCAC